MKKNALVILSVCLVYLTSFAENSNSTPFYSNVLVEFLDTASANSWKDTSLIATKPDLLVGIKVLVANIGNMDSLSTVYFSISRNNTNDTSEIISGFYNLSDDYSSLPGMVVLKQANGLTLELGLYSLPYNYKSKVYLKYVDGSLSEINEVIH